jgi:ABC-2 type transport system permease protein
MRRRLDLAGALVAEPPVLFLDEPTTGLDPRSRVNMWEVIRELVRSGTTLLLTTQYLEEADQLADDIIVIDHGRAIAHGTANELKAQVGGERVELVVASPEDLDAARRILGQIAVGVLQVDDPHTRALAAPVAGGAADLMAALRRLDADRCRGARRRPASSHARRRVPDPDRARRRPECGSGRGRRVSVDEQASADAAECIGRGGRHDEPRFIDAVIDGHVVAKRNVIKIRRVPEVLVWVLMSPVMFVLLFAYVFGNAITGARRGELPRVPHRGNLRPDGRVRRDVHRRRDRRGHEQGHHRPVPVPAHVALGDARGPHGERRDLQRAVDPIMSLTGLVVGWRIRGSVVDALVAYALLLLFAFAFSWVMAWVGLLVPSVEVINNASFMVIMPLTFVSNAFVPLEFFPPLLRRFVEWNPVSSVTQAIRQLFGNAGAVDAPEAWSMQHPVAYTLLWIGIILAVFVPLSVQGEHHDGAEAVDHPRSVPHPVAAPRRRGCVRSAAVCALRLCALVSRCYGSGSSAAAVGRR